MQSMLNFVKRQDGTQMELAPKNAEIEADNAARQDWNRTADMALVSGIAESKIIEIKKRARLR